MPMSPEEFSGATHASLLSPGSAVAHSCLPLSRSYAFTPLGRVWTTALSVNQVPRVFAPRAASTSSPCCLEATLHSTLLLAEPTSMYQAPKPAPLSTSTAMTSSTIIPTGFFRAFPGRAGPTGPPGPGDRYGCGGWGGNP